MAPTAASNILNHPHLQMIHVEGGTFWMGDDESGYSGEKPAHKVTVPDFYLGQFPITQTIWEMVMGENPSYFKGPSLPVESVSWDKIVNEFLPKLNELTDQKFRLPSEAEWEYAARGGIYIMANSSKHKKEKTCQQKKSEISSPVLV